MKRECVRCGAGFEAAGKGSAHKRFCSARCKWTHTNATRTLKPNVVANCIVCGNPFERYVEPSRMAAGRATGEYCSRACKGKALSGDRHPMWRGGRAIVNGYVWKHAPNHPHAKAQGYVLEHRLVMEQMLGRILTREEVVHHEDGNTLNNDPSNLKLFASNAEHKSWHERDRERTESGRYLPVGD